MQKFAFMKGLFYICRMFFGFRAFEIYSSARLVASCTNLFFGAYPHPPSRTEFAPPLPSPVKEGSSYSKTLYVNLFIPSELNWDGTIVRQETNFPESNKTTITVRGNLKNEALNVKLRYPYWATYMKINGKKVKAGKDGYAIDH